MPYSAASTSQDRAKAIIAVVAVHMAIGALLLARPGLPPADPGDRPPVLIEIEDLPPPPPQPEPEPGRARDEEGAAGKKGDPTSVVAPRPRIDIPAARPLPAAPIAGTGNSSSSGAARAGSGPGAGGTGSGLGGGGTPPRWVRGGLRDSDYPRSALRQHIGGTVRIRFTVFPNGRIGNCRIIGSSGSGVLDSETCRLLTKRLRFRPATDGAGRPIESELGSDYTWGIRLRH